MEPTSDRERPSIFRLEDKKEPISMPNYYNSWPVIEIDCLFLKKARAETFLKTLKEFFER